MSSKRDMIDCETLNAWDVDICPVHEVCRIFYLLGVLGYGLTPCCCSRWLAKPPVWSVIFNKLSLDLKIDTALDDITDEPILEAGNGDTRGMDADANVDEVNEVEKNS
jgi:hypothetical protein